MGAVKPIAPRKLQNRATRRTVKCQTIGTVYQIATPIERRGLRKIQKKSGETKKRKPANDCRLAQFQKKANKREAIPLGKVSDYAARLQEEDDFVPEFVS